MNTKSILIASVIAFGSVFGVVGEAQAQYGAYGEFMQLVEELRSSPIGQYSISENCRRSYGMYNNNGYRRATGPNYQWCVNEVNSGRNPFW